jgi:hypothetical protein
MKYESLLSVGFALLLLTSGAVAVDKLPLDFKPQSATGSMADAKTIDASALPQRIAPSAAPSGRFAGLRPQNGLSDAQFAVLKQQVAQRRTAAPSTQALSPASNSLLPLTPLPSIGFDGINVDCSSVIPSDMGLAVSGVWVVQAVNDCFAVYSKVGGLQAGFPKSLNALFGLPANDFVNGVFVSDPRAFYDPVASKFVISAVWENMPASTGRVYVAYSKTADPRGAWGIYSFNNWGTGYCPDFDTLGHGRYNDKFVGAVAVGVNLFTCSPSGFGSYVDVHLTFLPKAQLYKGVGFSWWYFYGFGGLDTIQLASVNDKNDESRAIFALSTYNISSGQCATGCSGLIVWAFSNVASRSVQDFSVYPEASSTLLPTSTYALPPNASQPYTINTIDTNDTRISGSVANSHGKLWATINTDNGGGGPGILAWEVHAYLDNNGTGRCTGAFLNACPDLSGAGVDREMNYDVSPSGGYYNNAYYGTIYPDDAGNIVMVFNYSGYVTYVGTNFLTQRVTLAPQATFHDGGQTLRNGMAAYGYGRWGDYTAATVDGDYVWFSGMYARSDGSWNTGIGKAGYTASTQP